MLQFANNIIAFSVVSVDKLVLHMSLLKCLRYYKRHRQLQRCNTSLSMTMAGKPPHLNVVYFFELD